MKIYLRNKENFNKETIEFYENNFDIVEEKDADIIMINDFESIETDKIVACNSTGKDHIKAKEIISLRGEDLSDLTAVAELTLGMAIYCTRIFKKEEVRGKTLGIIGYGRIGKQFAYYANELGMKFDYYEKEDLDKKLEYVLQNSDIISLHITSDESNRNFFKREHFEKMKDGAIFLNSARPWLVNQEDFYWALENKLSGAWVDFNMPFVENLVTTPHIGGGTFESKKKSELILANKLKKLYGTTR